MNARPAHAVTIAAEDPSRAVRLGRAVASHWPGDVPVRIGAITLEALLAGESGGELRPDAAAALVGSSAAARAVAESLRARHVAGVVLVERALLRGEGCRVRECQGEGVLVEAADADPVRLAAELYTLAERGRDFDALRREVRLMTLSTGGARGELDRIHTELNMAALVQQQSLPTTLPEAAGLDFAVLFRPCGYVSGDIYDVARLDERTMCFFIADAVGHGVPAALLTMVITRSLRTTEVGVDGRRLIPPGEVLARLNEEMIRVQRGDGRFATAVYGIIDEPTRRVTLACAGHPAPLVVGGGEPEGVRADGPLLGVFRDEAFGEASFVLAPGRSLLLYSDGFETAFPDAGANPAHLRRGNQNYLGRLAALPWPRAGTGHTLAGAFAELASALDEQAGSLHQVDDVTALAISPRALPPALAA